MIERARKPEKTAPRLDLDGAEWKLATAAWLAVIYVVSWFSIREPETAAPGASAPVEGPRAGVAQSAPQRVSGAGQQASSAGRSRPASGRSGRIRTRSS